MEKMDVAVAIAGAVILAVAIAGSALYGGEAVGGSPFTLTFPTTETDLQPTSASGSNEITAEFDVASLNVSMVTFTATVSTQVPHPQSDSVSIRVTAPDGNETTQEGTFSAPTGGSGTVEVMVHLKDAPAQREVLAASADAAARAGPAPDTAGTGRWTVVVTLNPSEPVPVPHAISVVAAVTTWQASAAAASGASR